MLEFAKKKKSTTFLKLEQASESPRGLIKTAHWALLQSP